MIVLAVLAVFAGCVVDEQPPEPQGYTVTLWEGNSYALAADAVDTLFDSIPSREGYLFGGWFFDNGTWQKPVTAAGLAASEEGTIIYAKWTATGDLALVTFYDHRDGVVLYRAYVEKGSDLSSFDISPTFRPADERYEYVFKGWDKDLTAIAGDTDVRPVYDEIARTYNVTFIVNNVAAKVVSVPYGGAVEAPDAEDISTYLPHINGKKVTFSGWSATAEELSSITEDTEVVALWSTEDIYFEVTFNYGDGQTTTQTVRYGEDAVPPTYGLDKPDDLGVDHVFVGWDNNYCFVTEDRVINAVYDDHTAWYRVDFYVDNVVYCRYYVEGGEASPMPADPVKPSDRHQGLCSFRYAKAHLYGRVLCRGHAHRHTERHDRRRGGRTRRRQGQSRDLFRRRRGRGQGVQRMGQDIRGGKVRSCRKRGDRAHAREAHRHIQMGA